MNYVEILSALRDLSPFALVVIGLLAGFGMWLRHRERTQERTEHAQLLDLAKDAHESLDTVQSMLTSSIAKSEEVTRQELQLLGKIAQELVNLNASAPGSVISTENAKHIISYQWNWCRDETIRLLLNSIENNHFRQNESLVARKVMRAWQQAAGSAKESVRNLSGLQYPYEQLFEEHIELVWTRAWAWALPLYHGEFRDKQQAMEDLRERIKSLFADILHNYYQLVEDIDNGTLYADPAVGDASRFDRTASEIQLGVDQQLSVVDDMARALREYQHGSGSGGYDVQSARAEMEERYMRKHGTDRFTADGQ